MTLADLAADLRAPTPTAAAELAAPARDELLTALDDRQKALTRLLQQAVERESQRLDRLAMRLGRPAASIAAQRQRLASQEPRLRQALAVQLERQARAPQLLAQRLLRAGAALRTRLQERLDAGAERLSALDPKRVLQRGYAWIEGADERPVLSVRQLVPGQRIAAVWADGKAHAQVLAVDPHEGEDGSSPCLQSPRNNP